MDTPGLLALESIGILISTIIIALRIIILWRQPYPTKLEMLGAGSMILGCLVSIYIMSIWCHQGVQILHWIAAGDDDFAIGMKLAEPKYMKMVFAADVGTVTALWLSKTSILAAYAPAYCGFSLRMKALFRVTVAVVVVTYLTAMSAYLFYCIPISLNWNVMPPKGESLCITAIMFTPVLLAYLCNIIADLLILSIPIIALIQLPGRTKTQAYGVATIVGLALITLGVSVYRVVSTNLSAYSKSKPIPVEQRNVHIIGNTFVVVPLLIAFSLPEFRVFLRGAKRNASSESQEGRSSIVGAVLPLRIPERNDSYIDLVEGK
ncbi:hypothetical protein FN846DRAFT_6484 [Sphaerosporella brunnea]|uniref:Rhodopsin domain-containing protein n=1 Tax=Sphaerosporella brunnea TaxID=1250544 RepID=A0A5J5FCW8_9PEZI|nr:hypothetical protein FN846DRAFT_6484 [Sphaerosporella brunnea]